MKSHFSLLLDNDFILLRVDGAEIETSVSNYIFYNLVHQSPLDRGCLTESVSLMTTSPIMEYLLFVQLIF